MITVTRQLWKMTPSVLGLLGGILGLFASTFYQRLDFSSLSCGCQILGTAVVPGVLGAIFGIAGGSLSAIRKREGGLLLIAGAVVAASPWVIILGNPTGAGIELAFYIINFAWWNALILAGGLLAFPRTRRLLKRLHEGGWLP